MITLQEYLTERLKKAKSDVDSAKSKVISEAQELNIKALTAATERLQNYEMEYDKILKDIVKHIPVNEIIKISNLKDRWSAEPLNLIQGKNLVWTFNNVSYNKKYSIEERDALIARFGYSFNDLKV